MLPRSYNSCSNYHSLNIIKAAIICSFPWLWKVIYRTNRLHSEIGRHRQHLIYQRSLIWSALTILSYFSIIILSYEYLFITMNIIINIESVVNNHHFQIITHLQYLQNTTNHNQWLVGNGQVKCMHRQQLCSTAHCN